MLGRLAGPDRDRRHGPGGRHRRGTERTHYRPTRRHHHTRHRRHRARVRRHERVARHPLHRRRLRSGRHPPRRERRVLQQGRLPGRRAPAAVGARAPGTPARLGLEHRPLPARRGVRSSPSPTPTTTPTSTTSKTWLDWYAENDIHVVLDFHQDLYGWKVGGNGAPDWAVSHRRPRVRRRHRRRTLVPGRHRPRHPGRLPELLGSPSGATPSSRSTTGEPGNTSSSGSPTIRR